MPMELSTTHMVGPTSSSKYFGLSFSSKLANSLIALCRQRDPYSKQPVVTMHDLIEKDN